MIVPPITGSNWADLIILATIFVILNRGVQHLFSNPKEYFFVKRRNKEIQAEIKVLMKENNYIAVQEKQKEAFTLMGRQFKGMFKTMIPLMILALPILYVVNKFYKDGTYLFNIDGFWTYFIITFILSIIVNHIYDKMFENKYKDYIPADYKNK